MRFATTPDPAITPAVVVAVLALLFTIGSFWWIQVRRGWLRSYEPHSFATSIGRDKTLLRLPLVLYNNGARPIVVQNVRLVFPDESDAGAPMMWHSSRTQLKPDSDDGHAFPAAFSVPGRSTAQLFIDFGGQWPGVVPEPKRYRVRIEAKVGHRRRWRHLVTFPLRAEHIQHPRLFIAYSNADDALTAGDNAKAEARAALAKLRAELVPQGHAEAAGETPTGKGEISRSG